MTDTNTDIYTAELVTTRQTIFDIPDPADQLVEARRQATAVTTVIDSEKLSMKIGRSEHVLFEGWATLGAFNGLSVHTVWTRPLEDNTGWEARCEIRTLDGRVVGTAEAMCSRAERNWAKADDYAIRSMAQTRAGSKAFKGPLSWVMVLAGKSATPAEEVTDPGSTPADKREEPASLPGWATPITSVAPIAAQLVDILTRLGEPDPSAGATQIGQDIFDAVGPNAEGHVGVPAIAATTIAAIHASIPITQENTP